MSTGIRIRRWFQCHIDRPLTWLVVSSVANKPQPRPGYPECIVADWPRPCCGHAKPLWRRSHRVLFLLLFAAPNQCSLQPQNMFLKPRVEQRVAEPVSFASGHPSLPSNSRASISFSLACSAAEVFRCTRFLMFASITARSLHGRNFGDTFILGFTRCQLRWAESRRFD